MNIQIKSFLVLVFIVSTGLFHNYRHFKKFPVHTHGWAQSDRYAISLGFLRNGFDLFHPETFIFNKQFPDNYNVERKTSVTAVDFPIHEFIVAGIMKVSGVKSHSVMRIYTFVYSCLGLFALFHLCLIRLKDFYKSLFVLIIAMSSPILIYYQIGFLPTIPSLSNVFIGCYFLEKFFDSSVKKYLMWSFFFLVLAALNRITFIIPFIAVCCYLSILSFKKELKIRQFLIPALIYFAIIISYFAYNLHLAKEHGSLFLNEINPISSFIEYVRIGKISIKNWGYFYFSKAQYILIGLLAVITIIYLIVSKKLKLLFSNQSLFLVIYGFGIILFFLVMAKQFVNHDYYFLDTFFPLIVFTLIYLLQLTPTIKSKYFRLISVLFLIGMYLKMNSAAAKTQEIYYQEGNWDVIQQIAKDFNGADKFLDNHNIGLSKKILVFNGLAPNIPFILMNRKGFVVTTNTEDAIRKQLRWKFDYIVIRNDDIMGSFYVAYPNLYKNLTRVCSNNRLSVFTFNQNDFSNNMDSYLNLAEKKPFFESLNTFENEYCLNWSNFERTAEKKSGNFAGMLNKKDEFTLSFVLKNKQELTEKNSILTFEASLFPIEITDCKFVVTLIENDSTVYYNAQPILERVLKLNQWQETRFLFNLPKLNAQKHTLQCYFYYSSKNNLIFDDAQIKIY